MDHHEIFDRLNKAITSLKIFPETIKDFTTILTQISLSENPLVQETEVHKLCGMYSDNSLTLMDFIKELVVQEFLEKAENEEQLEYTQLEADIDEATKQNGRLDKFISEGTRAIMLETLEEIDNIPYDSTTLEEAVEKIRNNAPKMNQVIEENKSALRGIKGILVDLKEGRGTNMSLIEEIEAVTRACDDIIELVNERLAF